MLRDDVQELWDAHTKMQQTVARLSDNAENLTTAQTDNTRFKKHIAEQDARALYTGAQHKKYAEGVGKSFLSMQNDMQAFVVQMTDNVNEQLLHPKEERDTNTKFLAERDTGHKDYARELTESWLCARSWLSGNLGKTALGLIEIFRMYFDTSLKTSRRDCSGISSRKTLRGLQKLKS